MVNPRKEMDSTGDEILIYSFKQIKQICEITLGEGIFNSYLKSNNLEWCYWHKSAICKHNTLVPFNSEKNSEI